MTHPRVLMTTDAVGGVWTYSLDLARGLGEAGVETLLAVLGPRPNDQQRAEAKAIPSLTLIETSLALDWSAVLADEITHAASVVAKLARERKVDLVHLNSPVLATSDILVPVVGVCHSCVSTWWSAVREGPIPEDFEWRTEALRKGMAACDALIAPSAAFAKATADAHRAPEPHVVHNGRQAKPAARPHPEPFVFTAGRLWDAGKNVAALDAAAALVHAPVLAAGPLDSPLGESVGLKHATSLGPLSARAVAQWLAMRPVFVSTALYEPFGLAVLEAAQAGCPLVLSDIPTFRELWSGAAIFVDVDDTEKLATVMQELLDDPERAAELGRIARRRSARYSVKAMTTGVLDVYRSLAPKRFPLPVREAAA